MEKENTKDIKQKGNVEIRSRQVRRKKNQKESEDTRKREKKEAEDKVR